MHIKLTIEVGSHVFNNSHFFFQITASNLSLKYINYGYEKIVFYR